MNRDAILSLYQFSAQANRTVLEVAARLTEEQFTRDFSPSHGTVQRLLIHLLGGEVFFPAICAGRTVDMSAIEELKTLDDIRTYWEQASADAEAYIAGLDDGDLACEIVLSFGEHDFRLAQWQVLLGAFAHSHQHRGELSILLSELGHPLPTIDLMVHFIRQSGQEWPFE